MMTLLAFAPREPLSDNLDHKLSHDTPTLRAKVTPTDDAVGGIDDSAPVVKVCKECMHSAPDDAEFCAECGDELVSIRRTPDMYLDEVVGGKYRIVEKIGQGGMGVVYLARNDELGQKVAVKFLSKKFANDENLVLRFLNEAKSYCRVQHPNAVTLLDYGQHDDAALFIITEFVEGLNVTETLKERGPLPSETVLDLGIQIAEVLSAAHSQGVIHRDLKPDNIMLMPLARGRYAVKVLDFGIAKIVDEEDGPNTETGSVFGTPEFMAPEQARGDEADPRSDIYALGVILFYMVTGRLPFRGKNKLVVLNMQLNEPAPRPREVMPEADISGRFEAVIMKCLNKGRSQRYANADDLLEALEELRVPIGHVTGKVGIVRDTVRTPTLRSGGRGDWDDTHSHADTLAAPIDDSHRFTDLDSIDMRREADRPRNAEQDRGALPVPLKVVAAGLLVVAVIGWFAIGSNSGPEVALEPLPMEDVVASSYNDALVTAITSLLDSGNLERARVSINQSTARDSTALLELEERLASLELSKKKFDAALAAGRCDDARAAIGAIKDSPGLALTFEAAAKKCRAKEPIKVEATPPIVSAKVEVKPAEPTTKVEPKLQVEVKGTAKADPTPDPPVDVQPDPPKDGHDGDVPVDPALPPRTLDE